MVERVKARVGAERRAHSDSKSLKFRRRSSKRDATEFQSAFKRWPLLASASLSPRQRPQMRLPLLQALRVRRCSSSCGDVVTVDGKVSARVNQTLGGSFRRGRATNSTAPVNPNFAEGRCL